MKSSFGRSHFGYIRNTDFAASLNRFGPLVAFMVSMNSTSFSKSDSLTSQLTTIEVGIFSGMNVDILEMI